MKKTINNSLFCLLAAAALFILNGCQTTAVPTNTIETDGSSVSVDTLLEGDQLSIIFPGAPSLDAQQKIRRDGYITLTLIGEVKAEGLTPSELEKELLRQYDDQIVTKEVTITVVSSSFPVFVTGAVLRPGEILTDRKITALEAILKAGGFAPTANMKKVSVTRSINGKRTVKQLNLKLALEGGDSDPYFLKPSDVIFVPEKIVWL